MIEWALAALALLGLVWAVVTFNRLVKRRNRVRSAWADIDVQLTRRHDLVPQIVTAVKAYAGHEQAVLEAVTELRSRAMRQTHPAELGRIESELESALSRLFALKEAYPGLEASSHFLALQQELVEIEDHLQYARRYYNGAVRDFNDAVQRVPDLLVARALGFSSAQFYQADTRERPAVAVQWS